MLFRFHHSSLLQTYKHSTSFFDSTKRKEDSAGYCSFRLVHDDMAPRSLIVANRERALPISERQRGGEKEKSLLTYLNILFYRLPQCDSISSATFKVEDFGCRQLYKDVVEQRLEDV